MPYNPRVDESAAPVRNGYRTIREFAADERPRERLLEHGAGVLGDAELIAIILRTGMAGKMSLIWLAGWSNRWAASAAWPAPMPAR